METTIDARSLTKELFCTSLAIENTMPSANPVTKMLTYTSPVPFRDGWRSIPDELRVEILRYALPSNENLCVTEFNCLLRCPRAKLPSAPNSCFDTHVVPLLAVPEIAGIVQEIFYAQNTMWLNTSPTESYPRHLPYAMGNFVRQMKLEFALSVAKLRLVRSAMADGVAFPNLDQVELIIWGCGGTVRVAGGAKKWVSNKFFRSRWIY